VRCMISNLRIMVSITSPLRKPSGSSFSPVLSPRTSRSPQAFRAVLSPPPNPQTPIVSSLTLMGIIKSKGTQILRAGWYRLQRYRCTLVSELPTHLREAGLENKLGKHTGAGSSGEQPWGGRCWSVTPQSHACASCAPECTRLQADISVLAKVSFWSET